MSGSLPVESPQAGELLTADQFMALPSEHVELVYGRVVETKPYVFAHGVLAGTIGVALMNYARQHHLGRVSLRASFLLARNPDLVRVTDACYMTHAALEGQNLSSYIVGAPTLAVEIQQEDETLDFLLTKAREYHQAGGAIVWIVQPTRKCVLVQTPLTEATYHLGESIQGSDVLPGFELAVADIFEE